ncbi:MAG TPA: hypothetical protein ENH82_13280 [bacterium]|nr:hypothetical protein [bacterium]
MMKYSKLRCQIPGCPNEYHKLLRFQLPTHSKQSEIMLCFSHYWKHFKEVLAGGNRKQGVLTINKCSYPIITTKTATEQYKITASKGGLSKKKRQTSGSK